MSTLTMGLAEAKNNFSRVTAEVNRTGKPVDFMDAYADVFEELAK